MRYTLIAVCVLILFLPSGNKPTPTPVPVTPTADLLDECHCVYRSLLSEVWSKYATERPGFANDEAALKWLNSNQTAAWTAAYDPVQKLAAAAAVDAAKASAYSTALMNKELK